MSWIPLYNSSKQTSISIKAVVFIHQWRALLTSYSIGQKTERILITVLGCISFVLIMIVLYGRMVLLWIYSHQRQIPNLTGCRTHMILPIITLMIPPQMRN